MEKLKRSLSFRKKKDHVPTVAKFKFRDGTTHQVDLMDNMKEKYVDVHPRLKQMVGCVVYWLYWLS